MPYSHYGNIGDIWKHLPLCGFLKIEDPHLYIETNSASPKYPLKRDPQKEYGIFTYIKRVHRSKVLRNAVYTRLLQNLKGNKNNMEVYLGSPGLAMTYLGDPTKQFIFFDIEREPLNEIMEFAEGKGMRDQIETIQQDSIMGSYHLLSQLDDTAFIHFDPYYAFEKVKEGRSYFDVFLEASKRGVKCMLWYCYFTLKEKREIHSEITKEIEERDINPHKRGIRGSEVYLELIEEDTIPINPGVLGCGILISNLSKKSYQMMELYSAELVKLYSGSTVFGRYPGDLMGEQLKF